MECIDVTRAEVEAGKLTPPHHEAAVAALRRDGVVVITGVINPGHVALLRERMLEDVDEILKRDDAPFNFNSGNLQQDPPPFHPYLFRDVLVNDLVVQVTKSILGRGLKNAYYSGNTNLPGSSEQPVHVDVGQLWPDLEAAPPAHGLVVNVPVLDMDERNGSTEMWPGTHLDTSMTVQQVRSDADIRVPDEKLKERRLVSPPVQPFVPAGGVAIRDLRLWHRGMPNHTPVPRPMIAMIHWCSWWGGDSLTFPRGTEALFEHPELHTKAIFVDGPIPYLDRNRAFDYQK